MPQTQPRKPSAPRGRIPNIKITSPAFADGGPIPRRYTADGENVSPRLGWGAPPAETVSLALLCEDPDAPSGTFVHWLVWNISPGQRELVDGISSAAEANDLVEGENSFGRVGYGGPKPPPGKPHRYIFRLYALDSILNLHRGAKRDQFERAIEGHAVATGTLTGLYGHD
jgi:Raf kinase inhibitor-like YbhB/YbcL family protein